MYCCLEFDSHYLLIKTNLSQPISGTEASKCLIEDELMEENRGLPLKKPNIVPPLDPHFRPAVLANRTFKENVTDSERGIPVHIAIEQRLIRHQFSH